MIFFFHHYELPALLEQIRQQQQQPQMPPLHHEQQAAADNNTQPADDSDQSGHGRPDDTEFEQQDVGVNETDRMTVDVDDQSHELSSVGHTVQGLCAEHGVQRLPVPHVGIDEASQHSAALTQPTSLSSSFCSTPVTSDEDSNYGCCAVATEETHVHCDMPVSPSCEATGTIPTSAADVRVVDSSMELRQRYHTSNSTSPSTSYRAFSDCQEPCTNKPRGDRTVDSTEILTDSGHAEIEQNSSDLLSTNPSHTE